MPVSPALPCRVSTCRYMQPCPVHAQQLARAARDARPHWDGWYRTAKWRRLRARRLDESPLCVECLVVAVIIAATDVDHVVPHRGDPVLFWDYANTQSLCHQHHSQKTGRGL